MDAVFDTLLRRMWLDPWLPLSTKVVAPAYGLSPVDEPDASFLARHTSDVTYMPPRCGVSCSR